MNSYSILVFFHVLGAITMFAAWAIEISIFRRLQSSVATGEVSLKLLKRQSPLGMIAMLITLITGIWMMIIRWGPQPWITAAFVAIVFIIAIGITINRRARVAIDIENKEEEYQNNFNDGIRLLSVSLLLRTSLGIGIVALMTMKPGAIESLVIIVVSLLTGIIISLRRIRKKVFTRNA